MGRKKKQKKVRNGLQRRQVLAAQAANRAILNDTVAKLALFVAPENEHRFLNNDTYREATAYFLVLLREWGSHLAEDDPLNQFFSYEMRRNANTQAHIMDLSFMHEKPRGFLNGCRERIAYYQGALAGEKGKPEKYVKPNKAQPCADAQRATLSLTLLDRLENLLALPEDWITQAALAYNVIVLGALHPVEPHITRRNLFAHPLSQRDVGESFRKGISPGGTGVLRMLLTDYQDNLPDYPQLRSECVFALKQLSDPEETAEIAQQEQQRLKLSGFYQKELASKQQSIQAVVGRIISYNQQGIAYQLPEEFSQFARYAENLLPAGGVAQYIKNYFKDPSDFNSIYDAINKGSALIQASLYDFERRAFMHILPLVMKKKTADGFDELYGHFQYLYQNHDQYVSTLEDVGTPLFVLCFSFHAKRELFARWALLGFDFESALKKEPAIIGKLICAYQGKEKPHAVRQNAHIEMLLDFIMDAVEDKAWLYQEILKGFVLLPAEPFNNLFVKLIQGFERQDSQLHNRQEIQVSLKGDCLSVSAASFLILCRRIDLLNLLCKHATVNIHEPEQFLPQAIGKLSPLFLLCNSLIFFQVSGIKPANEDGRFREVERFLDRLSAEDFNKVCEINGRPMTLFSYAITFLDLDQTHMKLSNKAVLQAMQKRCYAVFKLLLKNENVSRTYALTPNWSPFIAACHSANLKVVKAVLASAKDAISLERMLEGCRVRQHTPAINKALLEQLRDECEIISHQSTNRRSTSPNPLKQILSVKTKKEDSGRYNSLCQQQLRNNVELRQSLKEKSFCKIVLSLANAGIVEISMLSLFKPSYLKQLYQQLQVHRKHLSQLQAKRDKGNQTIKQKYNDILGRYEQHREPLAELPMHQVTNTPTQHNNPQKSAVYIALLRRLQNQLRDYRRPLQKWLNDLNAQILHASDEGARTGLKLQRNDIIVRLHSLQMRPIPTQDRGPTLENVMAVRCYSTS